MFRRLFLLLLLPAALLLAQPALPPAKISALERLAAAEMSRLHLPALSIAVADGSAFHAAAWGLSDLENAVPARTSTVFRLGSISKPITAVAVLTLVEQHKLDLDVPIRQYVPSFPEKPWPVTLRQILSHLGGIRHYRPDESDFFSTRHYTSCTEAISIFADDPLVHEPSTKYLYSTFGYTLVGAAIEAVTQESYPAYVHSAVLEPAGAATLRSDDVYDLIPNRTSGYRLRGDGGWENCALADTSNKVPGGGWIGAPTDLVRFAQAAFGGKLLTPASIAQMTAPQTLKNGQTSSYGLGWNIGTLGTDRRFWHNGGQQGTSTALSVLPDRRIVVAAMTNLEGASLNDLVAAMLKIVAE
jgi:serine beta-lactamase-like protein LACTB